MLDRETFHRLHAACTTCDDNVVVRASDLRSLLDAGAEIDRQCRELDASRREADERCEAMTRELAAAKTQIVELADRPPPPAADTAADPPADGTGA
jgi:hypothetical protein